LEDRWHIANYVYSLRDNNTALGKGVIQAQKITGNLPNAVDDAAWQSAAVTSMRLVPNLIKEERLFTPLNDLISVRALYNQDEIAFLIEVNDRTESLPGHEYSMSIQDEALTLYSDALAMQFPKEGAYHSKGSVEKPLYRHGDRAHNTTLWYWNAGSIEPKKAPQTLIFKGTGPNNKLAPMIDYKAVTAQGKWHQGRWQVIMKRQRMGTDDEINFIEGEFIPISFANWDGSNGEVKSKHTLSTWYWLLLPPESDPLRLYGIPALWALLIFIIAVWIVHGQRKKYKNN
jgi:DMSO reductase family type II enzyme heme b subunit